MHWVRGLGDGAFAAPRELSDASGALLSGGKDYDDEQRRFRTSERTGDADAHAIAVAPVDWDADGDLDLVLGLLDGRILLRRNHGTPTELRFAEANEQVVCGERGRSAWVPDGKAAVTVADWDGDGRFDLLAGSQSGAVVWWRNTGGPGEPAFDEPETLVPPEPADPGPDEPGMRTQVAVHDLDGDGRVDLLVGDHAFRGEGPGSRKGWVWLYRRLADPSDERADEVSDEVSGAGR